MGDLQVISFDCRGLSTLRCNQDLRCDFAIMLLPIGGDMIDRRAPWAANRITKGDFDDDRDD
ncbi:hypothetical protein [Paracoccus onubensis]|uniref:Uncharacterized protein n=1 Tax=Paracoccus onubensis TaxID=1675788 RepID=A0A418SU62_9RHOB|nr:hypothetical protein [Paracoccus onubensis]RJE84460.1 hypothetical protein D3P04_12450 [Paracoccus onubensis]